MKTLCALLLAAAASPASALWIDYPVKESGRAHCSADELRRPPPLYLIGECHKAQSSKKVRQALAQESAAGRLYAGLESGGTKAVMPWDLRETHAAYGVPYGESSRLYGVDSPFAYALVRSYTLIGFFQDDRPQERDRSQWGSEFSAYCRGLKGNPYAKRAWEDARAALGAGAPPFLSSGLERCEDWPKEAENIPASTLLAFASANNAAFVALANEKFLPAMGLSSPLAPYEENLVFSFLYRKSMSRSAATVLSSLRDRDMGDNAIDLYCRAAAEGKPLAVSVGAEHLSGIEDRLRAWAGERIPLRVSHSYDTEALGGCASDSVAAAALLKEIRGLTGKKERLPGPDASVLVPPELRERLDGLMREDPFTGR
ncbi:MAG: hypothetical protein WC969_10120 [Elusimicrobiota bacterium]|jgi:hypothetical protein